MTYADKLRAMADWLDDRPYLLTHLGVWDIPSVSIWLASDQTEDFGKVCRAMGTFTKFGDNGIISAKHEHGDNIKPTFRVSATISGACEKRTKTDTDGNPIMRPVTRYKEVPTGEQEPEVEWVCPESFLNL